MVAKKDETKKSTLTSKKTVSKKSTSPANVAKKAAINKLSNEVKKVKKESSEKEKQVQQKKEDVVVNVNKEVKTDGKKEVKTQNIVFGKINSKDKVQNVGKIAEIKNGVAWATGHRKRSIAKVSCVEKSGKLTISVNKLDYKKFFTKLLHQDIVVAPFALLGIKTGYVVNAEVFGGGKSGQADALKLGLSRCLSILSDEYAKVLRKNSFLTRDARKVEPKKAGLKKARKKEQFSKR